MTAGKIRLQIERHPEKSQINKRDMKQAYDDITSRLGKPLWWDEGGCPRYEAFKPSMVNDFYAREVALMRVSCQGCDAEYLVCVSAGVRDPRPFSERPPPLSYGDPPRGCCRMGASMCSETLEIREFWVLEEFKWVQKHSDRN